MSTLFPEIKACLICDDAREEKRRKLSLLGVYGVAPNVEILVRDFDNPIERITFAIFAGPGSGKFMLKLRLSGEDDKVLIETPDFEISIRDTAKTNNWTLGIAGPKFPRAGSYLLQLFSGNDEKFKVDFRVSQGRPEDFV